MKCKIYANTSGAEINFEAFKFSGGERHVKLKELEALNNKNVTVIAYLYNSDDVMELFVLLDALSRAKVSGLYLEIPYVPYARQDRVCAPGEAFGLDMFVNHLATALRSFTPRIVLGWDIHSVVAESLFDNFDIPFINVPLTHFVRQIPLVKERTVIVAPDKGAVYRAEICAVEVGVTSTVYAHKIRDPNTGRITSTEFPYPNMGDVDFLIVDDICDGGATFVELAKILRTKTTGKITLFVTHGIFSKGTVPFVGLIDWVYTANLFPIKAIQDFPIAVTELELTRNVK